jgi:predicted nucleic acid-binding protein
VILVAGGPLVAILDSSHPHHRRCVSAWRELREPLGTVWPAIGQAVDLLRDVPRGPDGVWEILERRAVRLLPLGEDDASRMRELMAKYRRRRMGANHAALVSVAEREGLDTIFTFDDADFRAYRLGDRRRFRLIPGPASLRRK